MKLMKEKFRYTFPGDELESAGFYQKEPKANPDEPFYLLTRIEPETMLKFHSDERTKDLLGYPNYISVINGELWLYPAPVKQLLAIVRYHIIAEM